MKPLMCILRLCKLYIVHQGKIAFCDDSGKWLRTKDNWTVKECPICGRQIATKT